MDAYLFGRIAGEVRSFTLPEEREALDAWAADCRTRAQDTREFDNWHQFVNEHLDTAAQALIEGKFPSITWTDGDVPLSVSYHLIPHEAGEDGCGAGG
ncbi:hypothetical protein [Nocardia vaccinii]|uniref:hypothetical protein n=1 Tax=Nocardia vaccinii TaxID=1822 RepID=UPI00083788BE|nr:hypothetical protein [Nocardia vaccinii]